MWSKEEVKVFETVWSQGMDHEPNAVAFNYLKNYLPKDKIHGNDFVQDYAEWVYNVKFLGNGDISEGTIMIRESEYGWSYIFATNNNNGICQFIVDDTIVSELAKMSANRVIGEIANAIGQYSGRPKYPKIMRIHKAKSSYAYNLISKLLEDEEIWDYLTGKNERCVKYDKNTGKFTIIEW